MLRKITMGVYNNSSSKRQKSKLLSKGYVNTINYSTNSKEKSKQIKDYKTPFNSKKTRELIKDSFYYKTEVVKTKRASTKRESPKKNIIDYSAENRLLNSKKIDKKNKSYFKEKKKIENKSKNKSRMINSKEKIKYKSSYAQISNQKNKRSHLISPKNAIIKASESISISPKKFLNSHLNINLSLSLNNNINSISFKDKSKKKDLNKSRSKNIPSCKKYNFTDSKISTLSKTDNKSKSKSKYIKNKENNNLNYNTVEAKQKLFSVNNKYSFYNNYSLYIINDENNLEYNKSQNFSSEKDYNKIINQKKYNEDKIIENLLKLEPRNWYEELIYISNRINKIGEISKNFNEILEKYMIIYNQYNWLVYSLSNYFKNILDENEKDQKENNALNYDNNLSNNSENWKKGFKWKNLYIRVIPSEKAKILFNEMKALNYFFFDFLQLLDTNSIMKQNNNYIKKAQLLNNIIFPLIGYSKIYNYVLFASAVINIENKIFNGKSSSDTYMTIEEIIEQSDKLINYYSSSCENNNNFLFTYKMNIPSSEHGNLINDSTFINKRNKMLLQIHINKYNDLDLESSLGENFYIKDLIQSQLFKKINNYNLIKIKQGKYIIFNLARYIPKLFDIKFKTTQKLNFFSDFNKEKKYFTLYPNHSLNLRNIQNKYIKTPEDVLDKIYNMKNNFTSPLNYKEIYINNIYFKVIFEKFEKSKKDYKSQSFVDHLFKIENVESCKDDSGNNNNNIGNSNNSNFKSKTNEEKNYIKGKYVILYDLIEPIKLDYSLIKNMKLKNDSTQINGLFFLKTNYFSHFYQWCEMLNRNNFNIKSYSDLKYFMKKFSINVNLLFFSLIYIKNEDIADIIKIHLLIKIIYLVYERENPNLKNISSKILLYIKNILYPLELYELYELSFGIETKNFNNFYSELLFYTNVLFLKFRLIDDYMSLGLFNLKPEKSKHNQNTLYKQIRELIPGFDSPKEFLKHIILIARKKPFCFLSEFEIKFNIIINPYVKFKSSLSLESMEGYLSKKYISFNKIITYSYLKSEEISGLILAKLLNIYDPKDDNGNFIIYDPIISEKNSSETNDISKITFNNNKGNNNRSKQKNKKEYYQSKRMINNKYISYKNNQDFNLPADNVDEFSDDYYLDENKSKVPTSFIDLSLKKKRLTSPIKESIKNETHILLWKDICDKISILLSPICYKLIFSCKDKTKNSNEKNKNPFLNYLKYEYKISSSEILKNWNECNLNVFQKIHTCTGNAEYALLKTYIYLFIYFYFIKKNKEESKKIISNMKSIFKTGFYRTSFNKLAIFNLFQGLCLEKGGEEYFAKSLILFLLTYGDPRGRNNDSHGIIQFPLWIICNETLKLKEIIIYEYFKEMFQALEYFDNKKNNIIRQGNNKKVFDYINNIKNNIGDLLSLNITNRNNIQNDNINTNITYNNISTFKHKNNKYDDFENTHGNTSVKNIFNSKWDSDYFISNEMFNKIYINREKINNYFFPSINKKFSNSIDDFYNEEFAVYIFLQIQSIFLNRHQLFDNEFINNLIPNDIFNLDNMSQSTDNSSSNELNSIEPKMREEFLNKTTNFQTKNKTENYNINPFMHLINVELLDKLSYKKNIPSGVIISFGNNVHNETSHEKYDILTFPRVVFKLKNTIIEKIYSGWEHNIVISKKGEIFTFGNNQSYQCGLPNQNKFHQNSIPDPINISEIYNIYAKSASCGNEHSLILSNNKEVYGIGSNEDGVLGYNDITLKSYKPLLIRFGEKDEYTKRISQISSGTVHNLALTEDGKIFSWGAAMGGQLGHDEKFLIKNSNNKKNYFLSKPSLISSFVDKKILITKISCGEAHSLAMTNLGGVFSWGFGSNGQLGLGFCEDSFEPGKGLVKSRRMIPEKMNLAGIKDIQCGKTFTMLINKDNKLLACGNNDLCQLGFKSELKDNKRRCCDLIYPTILDSFSTCEVIKISCGEGHCLAIINDNSFSRIKCPWSWGNNKFGQTGQGSIVKIGLPSRINLLLDYITNDKSEFEEISCGGFHSLCLIKRKKNINWIFDDFDKKISKVIDNLNL